MSFLRPSTNSANKFMYGVAFVGGLMFLAIGLTDGPTLNAAGLDYAASCACFLMAIAIRPR